MLREGGGHVLMEADAYYELWMPSIFNLQLFLEFLANFATGFPHSV